MQEIQIGYQIINDPMADYLAPLPAVTWFHSRVQAEHAAMLALGTFRMTLGSVESERPGKVYDDEVPCPFNKARGDGTDWFARSFFMNCPWKGTAALLVVQMDRLPE